MLYLIKGFLIYDKLIDHRHLFFACCRGGFMLLTEIIFCILPVTEYRSSL